MEIKPMTQPKQARYQSYLLRCWSESETNSDLIFWRFSLADLHTGQRRGFASLTELVIALQDELMGENQEVGSKK
jgi:hypothetical protein